jgi:DNA-binding PadR family transcriptional regulator
MMMTKVDIQTNLPLSEAVLFILLSLASEPKHGYAIMKDVQTLSENRVVLSTGTLYGALKRLLEQGWIERVGDADGADGAAEESGRPRKAYALTGLGGRILDAEVARLRSLIVMAQSRIAEEPV